MSDISESEEYFDIRELKLELLRFAKTSVLDGTALANLDIEEREGIGRSLAYEVSTLIPAEDVKTKTYVFRYRHTKTWWDGFKEKYFTEYLLSKFPAAYTEIKKQVTFKAYKVYPLFPEIMRGVGDSKQIIVTYAKPMQTRDVDRISARAGEMKCPVCKTQFVAVTECD